MINTAYKPQNPEIEKLQNALDFLSMKAKLLDFCLSSSVIVSSMVINTILVINFKNRLDIVYLIDIIFLVIVLLVFVKTNRWLFLLFGFLLISVGLLSILALFLKQKSIIDTILLVSISPFLFIRGYEAILAFNNYKDLDTKNILSESIKFAKANIKPLKAFNFNDYLSNSVQIYPAYSKDKLQIWHGNLLTDRAIFLSEWQHSAYALEKVGFELNTISDGEEGITEIKHPYFDSPIKARIPKTSLGRLQAWLAKHD